MVVRVVFVLAALGLTLTLTPVGRAQALHGETLPFSATRLVATTSDGGTSGALVEVADSWLPQLALLAPTEGGRRLRRFGRDLFVVDRLAGTVRRTPLHGGPSRLYDVGAAAEPMDVLVPGPIAGPTVGAWVTRRHDPRLLWLDLASGALLDGVDLSPVGDGATIALGSMIRHGSRLFVQVRVEDDGLAAAPGGGRGVLAVVDLVGGRLVDADRAAPGVQGVALQGAPPRFKMQILGETLYVSTTESFHDERGGVETVDLATLASRGFAVSEASGHSDMGGFVMLDAERGYYVFHTDLLTSTHLVPFTVSGGPLPVHMIDLLGDTVDVLVHDPARRRLYLPSGLSSNAPGLHVFDTDSHAPLGPPLGTGQRPHDALVLDGPLGFDAQP